MPKPKPKTKGKKKVAKRTAAKKPIARPVRKKKVKPPSERVLQADQELQEKIEAVLRPTYLGPELCARLNQIAFNRKMEFWAVLHEAAQRYIESEFVEPTTPAKDDALYPATEHPLEAGVLPPPEAMEAPLPLARDPVHHDEDGWWFWDETGADRNGPFEDEATARGELVKYCAWLDQPKPTTAAVN